MKFVSVILEHKHKNYILYCMEQSVSWEAFSQILHPLTVSEGPFSYSKCLPLNPIVNNILMPCFFMKLFNIILPSRTVILFHIILQTIPKFSKWYLFVRIFQHQFYSFVIPLMNILNSLPLIMSSRPSCNIQVKATLALFNAALWYSVFQGLRH